MPLAFSPDRTVEVCLSGDATKPVKTRPVFICKYVAEGDAQKMDELWKAERSPDNTDETGDKLRECIALAIVGWRNMPAEFGEYKDKESLRPLTVPELFELLGLIWSACTSAAPFVKPSESPTS